MKNSLYLGKIAGIKLFIHWTFLILVAWIVIANVRNNATTDQIIWAVIFVLAVFGCVTLHEIGHALAGKQFQVKTSHITLLPIGGLAQMEAIPEKPKEELIIAIAGPLVNVLIAGILYLFVEPPQDIEELNVQAGLRGENFWYALMSVNIILVVFNLIPAFPMDGGRVLRALLSFRLGHVKATRIAASLGQLLAIGFVFLGFMANPFLIFIGLFIFLGAQSEQVYASTKSVLRQYKVRDVLMKEIPVLHHDATVNDAVTKLLSGQNKNFIVMQDGTPIGTLSRDEIIRALHEQGAQKPVDAIKNPDMVYLNPDMPLDEAWTEMQKQKRKVMLITDNGRLTGIVDDENLAEFLLIYSEGVDGSRQLSSR
jgi:Zn-dependent protease